MLLLAACEPAPEATPPVPVSNVMPVTAITLEPRRHAATIETFGVVEGLEDVDIASEMAGTVAKILVQEGDAVQVGDVLLELDSEKQRYRVTQARQAAEQAKALVEEAQLRLERRKDLADKDTISQEDFDNARLRVMAVGASYQRALAAKRLAERELADTQVRSPSAGLVDQRLIEPGEPVAIGTTLLSLQVVHTMRVHTWVSEADIAMISANNPAQVSLSGAPLQSFEAVVEWVGVNADAQTGNFPVKLLLQDDHDIIRPGMTASARIEGLALDGMLVLPETALVDRERRRVVFVAEQDNGTWVARQREPQLAAGFANRLVVLAGLKAGDQVIVSGQSTLLDGSEIELN